MSSCVICLISDIIACYNCPATLQRRIFRYVFLYFIFTVVMDSLIERNGGNENSCGSIFFYSYDDFMLWRSKLRMPDIILTSLTFLYERMVLFMH